jgi:hypothetical protein
LKDDVAREAMQRREDAYSLARLSRRPRRRTDGTCSKPVMARNDGARP